MAPRVEVTVDNRTNSLIVRAAPGDLTEVDLLIRRVDQDSSEAVNQAKIFKLKNTLAADLSATLQNARLLGIEDVTGSIERGKCADFIVIEGNPLEDLDTLRNVSMVVARGKLIRNPKVKKMPQVEMELDKYL